MTQGVQCLHFDVIASLTPCHSVAAEYSPTQTAKYSVIGSCKILIQSYAKITLEWIVMISLLLWGLIKSTVKDPEVRFRFFELNRTIVYFDHESDSCPSCFALKLSV